MSTRTRRIARTTVILIVAIAWGTFEIVLGGARPPVLILVAGMMGTPAVLRIDEAIREARHRDHTP